VNAGTVPDEEVLLILEFPRTEYDLDLGASTTTFAQETIPYYNGMKIPSFMPSLGSTAQASLQYGQNFVNPQIIISKHNGFTTALQEVNIAFIKNPLAHTPARVKISLVKYSSGNANPAILFQATYTNYFLALAEATVTSQPLHVTLSNPYPQSETSITMKRTYPWAVNTDSQIFVRFKDLAKGLNYDQMQTISCTGYTIEWYKDAYIFFLNPGADTNSAVSEITCEGFITDSLMGAIVFETGIVKANQDSLYIFPAGAFLQALVIPNANLDATRRTDDLPNSQSINLYTLTYNVASSTNSFHFIEGTSLGIQIPNGLEIVPGLTEKMIIHGLQGIQNGILSRIPQVIVVNSNRIVIKEYGLFNQGTLVFKLYLRNKATGDMRFQIRIYDKNNVDLAFTNNFPDLAFSSTPLAFSSGVLTSFVKDNVDIYQGETYDLKFNLKSAHNLVYDPDPALGGAIAISFPFDFLPFPASLYCKYTKDNGAHWIKASHSITGGNLLMIPIVSGHNINANTAFTIIITTDGSDSTSLGLTRPLDTSKIHLFNIKTMSGGF